jgi:CRP/FNR family transcriptional regulator
MATKALANDVQIPAIHAIPGVPTTIARSADRAADAAYLLDISKQAEPCRTCAAWGGCHAPRLMAMAPENAASPHSRTLSQGEHVYYGGDEFKAVYVVRTGSVKAYLIDTAGNEQVVGFYLPGELLGLDALMRMGVHGSLAIALEGTAVCAIPVAHLERFARHTPGGLQWFLRLAGEEIAHCHHTQLMLNRMKAETRLSHFLLDLSRRFSERGHLACEFNLSMSRHDIGNHLGLRLETVSRLMTRFQQDGLMEVNKRRRITILDAAGLAAR